jgi:uncharacterized membrane protein YdfJ with MMPL/SSD domain
MANCMSIDPNAIYDPGAVSLALDLPLSALSRARRERRLKFAREGRRVYSTCGFILAGTFAALFAGSFLAMKELGFALAVGVLLDTLVVRPILAGTPLAIHHEVRSAAAHLHGMLEALKG